MDFQAFIVSLFGVFNILGGIYGYRKTGSIASLLGGGFFGIILLICSYGIANYNKASALFALIIALLLCGRFIPAMMKEFKVMPHLIISILGITTIITLVPTLQQ